jgi:hypothetical protein
MALALVCFTGVMMSVSGATPAKADIGTSRAPSSPPASVESGPGVVTVTVSGTGYVGGTSGSSGGGTVDVGVPMPCWMTVGMSGAEYFTYVTSGEKARIEKGVDGVISPLREGGRSHEHDDKGYWYGPICPQLPAVDRNEATVTVTFDGMDITAPGETPVPCAGVGTPYTPGADPTCALAFSQASSALGSESTPVTVKTRWKGTWAANGQEKGAFTPQPSPVTGKARIVVDEVQTLVTGAQ